MPVVDVCLHHRHLQLCNGVQVKIHQLWVGHLTHLLSCADGLVEVYRFFYGVFCAQLGVQIELFQYFALETVLGA